MLVPEPDAAPEMPLPLVAVQLNTVPLVGLVKLIAVVAPEQIVDVKGVAVTTGVGFTVMITGMGLPGQEFAEGITLYVTVPAEEPLAFNVCTMLLVLPALPPVAPLMVGVTQLNVVPGKLPESEILVVLPEQIVCAAGDAVPVGTGFTVTGIVSVFPAQPPDVDVIVYVAVPATDPVVLSVCAIGGVVPADAPVTPVCDTVQLYVVPPNVLDSAIFVAVPEQMVCDVGVAVITGEGLITTVTGPNTEDAHPPAAAMVLVMLYVPGALAVKSICPVLTFTKARPAGVDVNVPPLLPPGKAGKGLVPFLQYGPA